MVNEYQRRAGVLAIAFAAFSFPTFSTSSFALSQRADLAPAPSTVARRVDDARNIHFLPRRAAKQSAVAQSAKARAVVAKPVAAKPVAAKPVAGKAVVRKPVVARSVADSQAKASAPARPAFAAPARGPATQRVAARPRGLDRTVTGSVGRSDGSYGWLVTVNAKGVMSPKWTGAQSYGFIGYPTLSFRRPGAAQTWSSPDDSIQFALVENERFAIGPALAYRGGRYSSNAPELSGVHKPRWSLEGGVFADVWLAPGSLRARAELRRGMRGRDGLNGVIGVDYVHRVDKFTMAIGPRMKFGNDTFMTNQFGVTAADAARSGRFGRYDAKSDVYAIGAYASATYKQDDTWSYTVHGGYDRLRGDAGRSPLIAAAGSKNQFTIGAIVSYTFGWNGF